MGYYTWYDLQVENAREISGQELARASAALRKAVFEEDDNEEGSCPFDWVSYDSMKWYDYEQDMLALSTQFPDMLFCLYGNGEDSDDIWREFFRNGKSCYQRIKMFYDPPPAWAEYKNNTAGTS